MCLLIITSILGLIYILAVYSIIREDEPYTKSKPYPLEYSINMVRPRFPNPVLIQMPGGPVEYKILDNMYSGLMSKGFLLCNSFEDPILLLIEIHTEEATVSSPIIKRIGFGRILSFKTPEEQLKYIKDLGLWN